jgi:hypothetical protein
MSQSLSEKLGNTIINFVDKIDDDFNCTICLNVADQPTRCSSLCGAMFCGECMRKALEQKKCCPACNKTKVTSVKDVILRNHIMRQSVYCINSSLEDREIDSLTKRKACNSCSWVGKYDQLELHLKDCDYHMVNCPHFGCSVKVTRIDMDRHKQSCSFQLMKCEYCQLNFKLASLKDHHTECPCRKVTCTCGTICLAKNLSSHRENDCPNSLVQCKIAGCEEKVMRKEYSTHLSCAASKHMQLLSSAVAKLQNNSSLHSSEMKKLKDLHSEEIKRLEGLHSEDIKRLEGFHSEEIQRLENDFSSKLNELSDSVNTKTDLIKWRVTGIKDKMKEAMKEEQTCYSRIFDIFFKGNQKLSLGLSIEKKTLTIIIYNKNLEHIISLEGTEVVVSKKGKKTDLRRTVTNAAPLTNSEPFYTCRCFVMTDNMTPYIDDDGINIAIHLKLKVVNKEIDLGMYDKEDEDDQDDDNEDEDDQ